MFGRKSKAAISDVTYDTEIARWGDSEAHRDVKYTVPGNLSQLGTVFVWQMKKIFRDRKWIGNLVMIVLLPILFILIYNILNSASSGNVNLNYLSMP
ncbi:MAG: hypothetical protein Q4Q58_07230, partial [Thermoplasmata archaeon]|nr:hypothetical protein [Thermoplasmata archaeon]